MPPVLVREEPLFWTGFLPTDRAQIYEIANDDLFLVGTSEVSLAALHADEMLTEEDLPLRYGGFSTCFRREAGAAGRDTRGIFRVHQFDKVEMFSFVLPGGLGRRARAHPVDPGGDPPGARDPLSRREHRLRGTSAPPPRRSTTCEAWLPGQGRYRELTSCSNTTDYQARRLRCPLSRRGSQSPRPVHTLNGTAVAVGRTIVAIMENFQRADGGVDVPAVLRAYGAPDRDSRPAAPTRLGSEGPSDHRNSKKLARERP